MLISQRTPTSEDARNENLLRGTHIAAQKFCVATERSFIRQRLRMREKIKTNMIAGPSDGFRFFGPTTSTPFMTAEREKVRRVNNKSRWVTRITNEMTDVPSTEFFRKKLKFAEMLKISKIQGVGANNGNDSIFYGLLIRRQWMRASFECRRWLGKKEENEKSISFRGLLLFSVEIGKHEKRSRKWAEDEEEKFSYRFSLLFLSRYLHKIRRWPTFRSDRYTNVSFRLMNIRLNWSTC